ncbi:zona pellucida sperm-binding protein 3-like [Syngnathoides biaculeatus]|uniref:zona pellucida sperm-binding protein 3-like n=1 Tax=Syngnathoides biaculeatus TaxID=300417 RepID=UPI002ADE8D7B|nr:zona pellucida sperm-binding protein 3-like [Syngnathoides biaculeatus]
MAALLVVLLLSGVTASLAASDFVYVKPGFAGYRQKDPRQQVPATKQQQQQQQQRRPLNTVRVTCHPDSLEILIQADLFGVGSPVHSYEVRLGVERNDGLCSAAPASAHEYRILVGLLDCGTKYWMTDVSLVYTNLLVYTPAPTPDGLIRMDGAVVPIECHYARRYSLSSSSLTPTWIPFMATQAAVETLDFKLRIMTDDWQHERGVNVYYLGEPIFIEASVRVGHHVGLRVFLSSCVATLQPDIHSVPRYVFIDNGCLLDSKLHPSKSRFLVRTQDDKLQFVIDAFRFHNEDRGELYITCLLNAVSVHDAEAPNKACTFINGRWRSADGNDYLCGYCQSQSEAGQAQSKPAKFSPRGFSKPAQPESHWSKLPASGLEHHAKVGPVLVLPKQTGWAVPDRELPPLLQKLSRPALYGSQWMSGLNYLKDPENGQLPGLITEDFSDEDLPLVDPTSELDLKDEYELETATILPDEQDDNSTELVDHQPDVDVTIVSNSTDAQSDSKKK